MLFLLLLVQVRQNSFYPSSIEQFNYKRTDKVPVQSEQQQDIRQQ